MNKISTEIIAPPDLIGVQKVVITPTTNLEFGWEMDWLDQGTLDSRGNLHVKCALRKGDVTHRFPFSRAPEKIRAEALRVNALYEAS